MITKREDRLVKLYPGLNYTGNTQTERRLRDDYHIGPSPKVYTYLFPFNAKRARIRVRVEVQFGSHSGDFIEVSRLLEITAIVTFFESSVKYEKTFFEISKKKCKYSFTDRVVNEWYMLYKDITESSSLSAFKWKLCYSQI